MLTWFMRRAPLTTTPTNCMQSSAAANCYDRLKTRDGKTRNQTAGLVNAGKACMESQTVYFTCSIKPNFRHKRILQCHSIKVA